jgi:hypothetical protein
MDYYIRLNICHLLDLGDLTDNVLFHLALKIQIHEVAHKNYKGFEIPKPL